MNNKSIHSSGSYHFSFLKDAVVHGFYISSLKDCFSKYPFLADSHQFDFYSLAFFGKGKGTVAIEDKRLEIKPNRLFFFSPNCKHSFHFTENPQGYYTFFCQDFYADEFSMIRLLYLFSFSLPLANREPLHYIDLSPKENSIKTLFDNLFNEGHTTPYKKAPIVRSYLNILILKLTEILNSNNTSSNKETNAIILQLSHLIEANFMQQQQCEFYAKSLGITEAKINTICKKTFGTGMKKIIQERCIMEIRKMLEQTDLSIAEIAFKFNFSDNSYFNKVFKSYTRLTPGQYREIHKKLHKRY